MRTPNLISLFRVLLSILIIIIGDLFITNKFIFIVTVILAALSDFLDGYLARKYWPVSRVGTILDYTCDKIFLSTVLIFLLATNFVQFWIVAAWVIRDFLIMALRVVTISLNSKASLESEPISKLKTALIYIALIIFPFNADLFNAFLIASFALGIGGLIISTNKILRLYDQRESDS